MLLLLLLLSRLLLGCATIYIITRSMFGFSRKQPSRERVLEDLFKDRSFLDDRRPTVENVSRART